MRTGLVEHPICIVRCNMGGYLMICEVCKIREANIHGILPDTRNGEAKRLKHFCSTCFETSNGLDIARLEEDLECDISEDT
jgi:protein-arginine kinase activator protein McsA